MGAWGTGNFENDDALDWAGDFCEGKDDRLIVDTLKAVSGELTQEDSLEAPTAASALAAAEAVAALRGHPSKELPEELAAALKKSKLKPDARLLQLARNAIKSITTDERSELKGLWEDAGPADNKAWLAAVGELSTRLEV